MLQRLQASLDSPQGRILRYVVSALLVTLFAWNVNWRELGNLRGHFDWPLVLYGTLLTGLAYPLHAWRWWLLLRTHDIGVTLQWTHGVTWISQFYNAFLLGGLGGDAARVYYVCRDQPAHKASGIAAILLDRLMGLVVLMGLAILALAAKASVVAQEPGLQWVFVLALATTIGGIASIWILLVTAPRNWPRPLRRILGGERVERTGHLLARIRTAPRANTMALAITCLIWVLDFIAVWLTARAVGLPLPFVETCIAVSVAYAATVLPISVGGHGIREGAMLATLGVLGLATAGTTRDRALLLVVLLWGVSVLWSLVGGLFLLFSRTRKAATA